jgi:hypothetical protein
MRNHQGWLIGARMRTNYVLIDYENVQVQSLDLLQQPHFRLRVFLGPNNSKLPRDLVIAVQRMHERAEYVQLDTPGSNALDFHVTYYLGTLTAQDPTGYFHIISRDKGFDSLIKHLRENGIAVARSESIEDMPCFKPLMATAPAIPIVVPAKPLASASLSTLDDSTIKLVVTDLISRKASKPRTVKTLMNTIHAKVGKNTPIAAVEGIYKVLCERGYVLESEEKVTYRLPQTA